MKRQTGFILNVFLVILGLGTGPQGSWMCGMASLDVDKIQQSDRWSGKEFRAATT